MGVNLKDEEEVKQYLHNLGIEYRFGCYQEKKPEVCHLLGDYLEAIKKDFDKAAKVYKTNCDDYNFGKSCQKFGNYSFVGKGNTTKDTEVAFKYYKKACDLGETKACFNVGVLNILDTKNSRKEKDYALGVASLRKCCDDNDAHCCFYVSTMFLQGLKNGFIEKDMAKAYSFSLKACDLGSMQACANVSQMYRRGDGVDKNEDLAEKYKKKALELQQQTFKQQQLEFQQGTKPV
ncbi:cytochrome c oxidase assembly factor 7 homolog [Schistocerca gregaria]|uniref:cytochrome c oxidase assembly factor 7 homolog n=1 Tax=Schistocerca gregaria TaxID=7010 RepID=UPI00211E0350|nr:cytochrome c oxidase assembly factor 7 homolog [Schistocerca gregaria]